MKRSLLALPRPALGLFALALAPLLGGLTAAQSNTVAGRDVSLSALSTIASLGRTGVFPNGVNGFAQSTTSCNVGTSNLPWFQPMDADHPFISFLVMRETNGRMVQISDRSFVKHGFFATNSPGCGSCQNPGSGSLLGVGCSDTYSTSNNGDNFWLAPADEIDPWTGLWNPVCSHFDAGEPAVGGAAACDGNRSLSSGQAAALGAVGHRIRVLDSDLDVPGSTFYFQAQYTTQGEAEALRDNNFASRSFTAVFNVVQNRWNLSVPGAAVNPITYGSVLQRWSGAQLTSATNGGDDGRLFIAARVSGPTDGLYRYEYALHNRDNSRGFSALRIPICADARVLNVGFHDPDQNAGNDWSLQHNGTELVFEGSGNPLNWNTVFNFWFDSDAAPIPSAPVLADQARPGAGAAQLSLAARTPGALFNVHLGDGCADSAVPVLYAAGTPPQATIGNASFQLQASGLNAGSPAFLLFSSQTGSVPLGSGCTQWLGGTLGVEMQLVSNAVANGSGVASFAQPIPNNPAFEGFQVPFQAVVFDPSGGALFGNFDLSNGLLVRVGSSLTNCP
jgi:hypothetical protein